MNEKSRNQKSTSNIAVSIILFVFVGLTVIFAARQFIFCHQDVMSAIDEGMSITENLGDILFYYLESCGQYLFTGAILFGLGWIILHQGKTASSIASSSAIIPQGHIDLQTQATDNVSEIKNENTETEENDNFQDKTDGNTNQ